MSKNTTTIEDAKKNKIKLEKAILDLVTAFEKDNGIYINYVNLNRKYDEDECCAPIKETRRIGNLINVEASMELDLVY